jgi:hypothetical protein
MLHLSYYVVLGCVACLQVGSWAYFRRYQINSPPIGVFNVQDLAVMVLLIILVPLFYLILPLWLTVALLLLVALSILYFTWEPLLRARWAIWLATATMLVVDSGAAFLGTKQNVFFAVNNIVLLVMGMGITNLWAQSGMKARDTALLGILLALYDFIATVHDLPARGTDGEIDLDAAAGLRQARLTRLKGSYALINGDTLAHTGCTVAAQLLRCFAQAGDFAFLLRFRTLEQRQGVAHNREVVGIGATILFELVRKLVYVIFRKYLALAQAQTSRVLVLIPNISGQLFHK